VTEHGSPPPGHHQPRNQWRGCCRPGVVKRAGRELIEPLALVPVEAVQQRLGQRGILQVSQAAAKQRRQPVGAAGQQGIIVAGRQIKAVGSRKGKDGRAAQWQRLPKATGQVRIPLRHRAGQREFWQHRVARPAGGPT
jgi:hypothetical protein